VGDVKIFLTILISFATFIAVIASAIVWMVVLKNGYLWSGDMDWFAAGLTGVSIPTSIMLVLFALLIRLLRQPR
jgi:hypothetical protein